VRDFYLAGSTDFVSEARDVDGVLVRSTTLPGLENGARHVLDFTEASLRNFGDRFGAYPFTELDMVSTPTLALGVEYPGVIAMAQRMYPEDNLQYPLPMLEGVTAHEVAHQWFYSLVGNDQIDQPWLDESLAQFVTLLYFGDRYGPQGAAGYRASLESRWDQIGREPIPIGQPVAAYTPAEYSGIVYGRGGLFFEAIADEIGQKALAQGLRQYAQQNWHEIGTRDELQAALEDTCGCDLDVLFHAWVGADD
jgi:aminopeptidase N